MNILTKISYGLYVITTNYEGIDNGCIANTLMQQTENPLRLTITLNNSNYTCELAKKSKALGVAILSTETSFEMIKLFGMSKGNVIQKFAQITNVKAQNGVLIPTDNVIGYLELQVVKMDDLGTHTLFLCDLTNSFVFQEGEALTYAYYHARIKPQASINSNSSYVCTICGYEHIGEIPDGYVCPLCNHGKEYFEKK